jgi:hypothetical protein
MFNVFRRQEEKEGMKTMKNIVMVTNDVHDYYRISTASSHCQRKAIIG